MSILAQTSNDPDLPSTNYALTDNRVLEEFRIPFGEWIDQSVDWITVNLKPLLAIIEWPFSTLIDFFVGDILEPVSWVLVVLFFFIVGTLVRNVQVGIFAAVALTVCGLLGNTFWLQTARTIGYIGVAVVLCVIIGIPIGVACGRIDSFWQVVRPVLDAMQVVHSFVYMLPFIFFWGIGPVSATMVTMVFALPPLIRLTNLGVRQVPADVVEASRAYGAPERRVLFDVQMPLARQAIMTGINQTLLLSISMLGIAAIMGAGGLGRLLFNALSRQDVALGGSSGLSFFLVAVVLDRVSQTEATDKGSIFKRIRLAWAHRTDPEVLLQDSGVKQPGDATDTEGAFAKVSAKELQGMFISSLGGLLAIVSVFSTWTIDGGLMSAFGRRSDEILMDESFNGLSASGGSWFGILVLTFGFVIVGSVLTTSLMPGRGPRFLTTDGALVASIALLIMMIGYLATSPVGGTSPETGIGVYVALMGGVFGTVGSLLWIRIAAHSPIHPLRLKIGWGRILGGAFAVLIILGGAYSAWSFDERTDTVVSPETEAQIEELRQRALLEPANAGAIAAEISTLRAQLDVTARVITGGVRDDGSRIGIWATLAGFLGLLAAMPASGLFKRGKGPQLHWSSIACGIGMGVTAVGFGWIVVLGGIRDDGSGLGGGPILAGFLSLVVASPVVVLLSGLLVALPVVVFLGRGAGLQWRWSAIACVIGVGAAAVWAGWILVSEGTSGIDSRLGGLALPILAGFLGLLAALPVAGLLGWRWSAIACVIGVGAAAVWAGWILVSEGTSGIDSRLGGLALPILAGFLGLLAALPVAGIFGQGAGLQWRWSGLACIIGVGAAALWVGWILVAEGTSGIDFRLGVGALPILAGFLGLLAALPVVVFWGQGARLQWRWSAIACIIGVGATAVWAGWILVSEGTSGIDSRLGGWALPILASFLGLLGALPVMGLFGWRWSGLACVIGVGAAATGFGWIFVLDGMDNDGSRLGVWAILAGYLGLLAALPVVGLLRWRWSAITCGMGIGIAAIWFGWILVSEGTSGITFELGVGAILAGFLGLLVVLPAAGLFGRGDALQWRWSAITCGIGIGVAAIGFGWIFVHVRSADPNYTSGVGTFLTMLGGLFLAATAISILRDFRRSKVYGDSSEVQEPQLSSA